MVCLAIARLCSVWACLQYVNNSSLADISFIVEGRPFYAHRIALVAASDAFKIMFDGCYKEKVCSEMAHPPHFGCSE